MLQLGKQDHDRQAVHKAEHDRVRDEADELAQTQDAGTDLKQPRQYDRGKQVGDAVARNQRHHYDGHRPGGARNHARPTADQRGDQAHKEGAVKPDQWLDAGDERESNRLGDQCQRDSQARQHIVFDALFSGAGELEHRGASGNAATRPRNSKTD